MNFGRYDGLTMKKRYEVYILLLMVIGGMAGAFYLGAYTTQQTTNIASQQIYNQGVAAGEARGMNKMQSQCANELVALRDNCKPGCWVNPDMRFGNVELPAQK